MNLIVNAAPMTGLLTGIARYLRNMYSRMAEMEQVEISYLVGKELARSLPPLADSDKWQKKTSAASKLPDQVIFGIQSLRWLSHESFLRKTCRKSVFNLYHETAFVPAKMTEVPTVFSIYDLSLRRYRNTHPRERVWFFEYFIKRRMPFVNHILTISEFIRQEIIEEFKVPAERVTAVPLAPDPTFSLRSAEDIKKIKQQYRLPQSYLLFVSSLEPRKNIDLLIEAMHKINIDIPLVLVGWHGWGSKEWLEKIKSTKLKNRIHIIGHVPDEHLAEIYNGATALVYPSLYEGFGLPIVEAMACGCPVICSDTASMPEAAGDAAFFINPKKCDELSAAIECVVNDEETRRDLIRKGQAQVKRFSWERTARETLDLFKKVSNYK